MNKIDIESIILGSILVQDIPSNEWLDLTPDIFDEPLHKKVIQAMINEAANGRRPTYAILLKQFSDEDLDSIIERAKASAIIIPDVVDFSEYKNRLLEQYEIQRLQTILNNGQKDIINGKPPSEVAFNVIESIKNITISTAIMNIGEAINEFYKEQGELFKLPWSQTDVYFSTGQMITLSGKTSVGKTSFWMNWMFKEALRNKKILVFDYEMGYSHLLRKFLSIKTKRSSSEIKKLYYSNRELFCQEFKDDLEELRNLPIYINRSGSPDRIDIVRETTKLHTQVKLDYVVIDYVQLIPPANIDIQIEPVHNLERICATIKNMSRDLNVVVILVSQFSRKISEASIPSMYGLKGSSAIEQESDSVIVLYRQEERQTGTPLNVESYPIVVDIQKNRDGPTQMFELVFCPDTQIFEDPEFGCSSKPKPKPEDLSGLI